MNDLDKLAGFLMRPAATSSKTAAPDLEHFLARESVDADVDMLLHGAEFYHFMKTADPSSTQDPKANRANQESVAARLDGGREAYEAEKKKVLADSVQKKLEDDRLRNLQSVEFKRTPLAVENLKAQFKDITKRTGSDTVPQSADEAQVKTAKVWSMSRGLRLGSKPAHPGALSTYQQAALKGKGRSGREALRTAPTKARVERDAPATAEWFGGSALAKSAEAAETGEAAPTVPAPSKDDQATRQKLRGLLAKHYEKTEAPVATADLTDHEKTAFRGAGVAYLGGTAGGALMGHGSGKRERRAGKKAPKWGVGKYLGSAIIHPYGAYQIGKSVGYNKEDERQARLSEARGAEKTANAERVEANLAQGMTLVEAVRKAYPEYSDEQVRDAVTQMQQSGKANGSREKYEDIMDASQDKGEQPMEKKEAGLGGSLVGGTAGGGAALVKALQEKRKLQNVADGDRNAFQELLTTNPTAAIAGATLGGIMTGSLAGHAVQGMGRSALGRV